MTDSHAAAQRPATAAQRAAALETVLTAHGILQRVSSMTSTATPKSNGLPAMALRSWRGPGPMAHSASVF